MWRMWKYLGRGLQTTENLAKKKFLMSGFKPQAYDLASDRQLVLMQELTLAKKRRGHHAKPQYQTIQSYRFTYFVSMTSNAKELDMSRNLTVRDAFWPFYWKCHNCWLVKHFDWQITKLLSYADSGLVVWGIKCPTLAPKLSGGFTTK